MAGKGMKGGKSSKGMCGNGGSKGQKGMIHSPVNSIAKKGTKK